MSRNARLALVLAVALGAAGAASFVVYRVVAAIPVREVAVKSIEAVVRMSSRRIAIRVPFLAASEDEAGGGSGAARPRETTVRG